MNNEPIPIVQKCINIVGGITRLAEELGVRHQTFYSWRRVPAERVLTLERVSGISRHRLRPDLYPIERPLLKPGEPIVRQSQPPRAQPRRRSRPPVRQQSVLS